MSRDAIPSSMLGLALGLSGACVSTTRYDNPDHCANNDGDAFCAARYSDGSRPFCQRGNEECGGPLDGCVDARPQDACYSPCGGKMSLVDDPSCEGVADGSGSGTEDGSDVGDDGPASGSGSGSESVGPGSESDSGVGETEEPATGSDGGSSSGEGSSTGPGPQCEGDEACVDDEAPFCVDEMCVPCSATEEPDAACEGKFPALPVCEDDACVQCTADDVDACMGTTPICNAATNTCEGCTSHAQCPDSACDLETGACFDVSSVVHVDGDGGQDFTTIAGAVASFSLAEAGVIVIHDAAGNYNEGVTVDLSKTLALLAAPGETPTWVRNVGDGPQLTVSATAYLVGLELAQNGTTDAPGLLVDGGTVWAQASRIVANFGGGILVDGGSLTLENCFVGGENVDQTAVDVQSGDVSILYSTLAASFGASAALACSPGAGPGVSVRNSILVSRSSDAEVQCSGATLDNCATEAQAGAFPSTPTDWFVNYAAGDFHLQNDALDDFEGIAQWELGDPPTDLDGDDRPSLDGAADWPGADVPD